MLSCEIVFLQMLVYEYMPNGTLRDHLSCKYTVTLYYSNFISKFSFYFQYYIDSVGPVGLGGPGSRLILLIQTSQGS